MNTRVYVWRGGDVQRMPEMGHRLNPKLRAQGDVSAILIEEGSGWRVGWADGRRGGAIKGY